MTAHEAHLMRELQRSPIPAPSFSGEFVPIMLCKAADFEPPMDWALSRRARDFIAGATGYGDHPHCLSHGRSANRAAIEHVAALISGKDAASIAGMVAP
jgi:hypothetical protein